MTAIPVPSETAAVSSGSSIARNDPNTRNSTTAAAMKPKPRLLDELSWLPCWAIWPSTSNSTLPLRGARDLLDERLGGGVGELVGLDVEGDVREADLAGLGDLAGAAGLYGCAIVRHVRGPATVVEQRIELRARTAGSVSVPDLDAITICSVSPEAFGALRWSSRIASKLSRVGEPEVVACRRCRRSTRSRSGRSRPPPTRRSPRPLVGEAPSRELFHFGPTSIACGRIPSLTSPRSIYASLAACRARR